MRTAISLVAALLLPFPGRFAGAAPGQGTEWFTFSNSNFVYDMCFHEDVLWLGTNGGLLRFDPAMNTLTKYTNVDGLAEIEVRAVVADTFGNIWSGTASRGLSVRSADDGEWATYTSYHGLPGNTISVLEALADTIWVGTDAGLWVLSTQGSPIDPGDDRSSTYAVGGGLVQNTVRAIAFQDQRVWVGTEGGVSVVERSRMGVADAWVTYTTQDGLAGNKIRGLAVQGDTVWAATDAGVSRFLAGSWTTSLGAVEGRDIMVNGGEVWCATSSGVRRFSGTAWSVLNAGLATSDCRALAADAQNTVWVGLGSKDGRESHGSGFAGWRGSAWQGYTSDGLPDNAVVNIAFEASGRVWVSTAYGGVGVWDGTSWTNFTSGDGLARDVYLYGLAVDRFNRKWFGTWGAGVSRLEDRGTADKGDDLWITLTPGNSGLSGIHVPVIFVDSHGDLYFGSQGPPLWTPYPGAVDRLSSDTLTWSHYDLREQGAWNVVKSIAESRDGLLWFGIENYGALRLDDGGTPTQPGDDSWESFTTEDGLVDNTVWVIAPDPVAGMWFGTNNGVSLYRDLSFTNLTRAQGLPGEVVRGVAVDSQGDVYFGLIGGGLSRYDPVNRSWAFYNSGNSSLVFDDVGAINIRAHDERRDELWIATDRGLSRLVLPNPSPSSPSEARVCPNPFLPGRGDREIVFSDVPDNSVLRIYGLAAELVRRIGLVDVRRHTMSWDGRNESGRPVASGMYLYVVSSPQGERLGKLCIIR